MARVIVFQNGFGGVAVIHPVPAVVALVGMHAIGVKDVPAGKPFAIIEDSLIPTDRTLRDAWTVDAAQLTDGVGGESNEFPDELLDSMVEVLQ